MQFSISQTKVLTTFALILMASMLLSIVPQAAAVTASGASNVATAGKAPAEVGWVGPITNADPTTGKAANYTISDLAFLSVSPNPIGVNQMLLVNVWITFPSGEGKFMNGYTVSITKPDGITDTVILQSYVADGTSWFDYIPTQVGTYQFVFSFLGEYFPAGYYSNGLYNATYISGWIYNPSDYCDAATSPVTNLTVQSAMVPSWSSLDTMTAVPGAGEYWSRPIEPNNREWNVIAGNFPNPTINMAGYQSSQSWHDEWFGPYVPAVNTPHILWDAVAGVAGVIGGDTYTQSQLGAPSAGLPVNTPSVIYMGRCYTTVTKSINGGAPQPYAECYDLQTGKIYYDIATANGGVTPTYIAYWTGVDLSVPGSAADAAMTIDLFTIVPGATNNSLAVLDKINPNTGAVTSISTPFVTRIGTVTQVIPGSPSSYSMSSDIANFYYYNGYFLSFQWVNSTTSIYDGVSVTLAYNGYLINWTEQGSAAFSTRIVGNISLTLPESYRTLYEPNFGYGYGAYDPVKGINIVENRFIYGGFYGSSFEAQSFVSSKPIGGSATWLWNISTSPTDMVDAYRPTNAWCSNGVYAYEMERGYIEARSETTGTVLWSTNSETQSPQWNYPWGEFWLYDEAQYGQLIYAIGYTGVYALNETNGALVWQYSDPAPPFETPYTTTINGTTINEYSISSIRVAGSGGADGIVYVQNNEHTPTLPPERGWGLVAINATTGAFLWKVMGTDESVAAAADGYLIGTSAYDGTMYVMGMGPSATTISAPQAAVTSGDKVVISGTVLDQSPAQPGTPCVADQYQDTWMDYLHMQMPINGLYGNITVQGVPVIISAVDPNGNSIPIATVTSDISGTFSYTWTAPTLTGDYKIMATFAGSNSYGASWAETHATVVAAPPVSPTPTPVSISGLATTADLTNYILVGVIVIIIAIAIVGILMLRKHP